jgi:hypothetical protein
MEAAGRKRLGQQIIAEKQKLNYVCPMTNPALSAKPKSWAPVPTVLLGGKRAREISFNENPA